MAIKTKTLKEETREVSFPCLMKSKPAQCGFFFLFLSIFKG